MQSQLSANDARKVAHEMAVAQLFVGYLKKEDHLVAIDRAGDHLKGEPDVICTTPQGYLGLEITRDTFQASERPNLLGNLPPHRNPRHASSPEQAAAVLECQEVPFKNMDENFATRLQAVLNAHAGKRYTVDPTYIIVDGTWSPFVVTDHAQYFLDRLCLADCSLSKKAFLLLQRWGALEYDFFELARCTELRTPLCQQTAGQARNVDQVPAVWTLPCVAEAISPQLAGYTMRLKVKPWATRSPEDQSVFVIKDARGAPQWVVVGMVVWSDESRAGIAVGSDISGSDEVGRYPPNEQLLETLGTVFHTPGSQGISWPSGVGLSAGRR